jgi:NADPH-dependent glutamate synthase beta subunit-like oxidoreductase
MNGLASLLRYQMGGPVGYVDGGQIDSIYNTLFGRLRMLKVEAYYEEKLKNASVADAIAIIGGGATGEDVNNEDLRQKIADETIKAAYENVLGRPEDVAGLQFYQDQVLNQGLDPTQIDDIFADSPEAQVRKDAEEFLRRLEAGEELLALGLL